MQLVTPKFIVDLLYFAVTGALVALAIFYYSRLKAKGFIYDPPPISEQWQTAVFIIALFVVFGLARGMFTSLSAEYNPTQTRIPSALTVRSATGEEININFYWDVLGQDRAVNLDYGAFEAFNSSSLETWVRNESPIDVWLTLNWTDLAPVDAGQYISYDWNWVKLIDTWLAYPETFSIVNAQLVCLNPPTNDPIIIARVDPGFNQEISTRTMITSSTTPESQIVFRYVDAQNYYFAGLGAWGYKAGIGRIVNGATYRIAEGGNPSYLDVNLNQWYDLKVRVSGSTFTVYIDGEEICAAEDSSIGYGDVGVRAYRSDVVWDSFTVVDAFDPDMIIFEDFFVGAPLEVGTSRKVTFTVTSTANPPVDPGVEWLFNFGTLVTAYDNAEEIKYPVP